MTISPLYLNLIAVLLLECTVSLLIGLLIYLLILSLKKKRKIYQYKIYNFFLNKLYILCYFFIFILFFSYIRIKRVSLALDLKIYKVYIENLWGNFGVFLGCFIIINLFLLVVLLCLIVIKINSFFIKELKKYHLFLQYKQNANGTANETRYENFLYEVASNYGYRRVTSRIIGFFIGLFMPYHPVKVTVNDQHERDLLIAKLRLILKIIPFLILIFLIIYDCYFNNFIITKAFYYTLIYIPYIFWYRITTFLWHQVSSYNSIVYEHYYCKDRMMYINVPSDLEEKIIAFISNGLQVYDTSYFNNSFSDDWLRLQDCRIFSQDGKIYTNSDGSFIDEDPKDKEIDDENIRKVKMKFKNTLIFISFISIVIILFYQKLTIKESVELPLKVYTFTNLMYLILIFIVLLLAILAIIIRPKIDSNNYYLNFIEKIKQNLDFLITYIDIKFINFDEIYRYFGFNKKKLFQCYILANWGIRMIVFIVFILDIFYFNHLAYFYKILPLMLIPFSFQLIFYFIKRYFDIQCHELSPKVQPFVLYTTTKVSGIISLKDYIHQTSLKLLKIPGEPSKGTILLDPDYIQQWEISTGKTLDQEKTLSNYKKKLERLFLNYIVIYRFESQKTFYALYFNILIRFGYFLGWSYVFYLSDPLSFYAIINVSLNIYRYIKEPFSELPLEV